MTYGYPMGTYDAICEVVRYLQERYDRNMWRHWWKDSDLLADGIQDAAQKLWAAGEVLYAADMRLARACMILMASIPYMPREEWQAMVRRVWELLCDSEERGEGT